VGEGEGIRAYYQEGERERVEGDKGGERGRGVTVRVYVETVGEGVRG
jgi:hypothetical protein